MTTDYVLDETYTLLRLHASLELLRNLDHLLSRTRSIERLWIAEEDFHRVFRLMLNREDRVWSFTDCTSFIVMESRSIRDAFSFDGNFAEAGYSVHP